jgi:hypothetical protein
MLRKIFLLSICLLTVVTNYVCASMPARGLRLHLDANSLIGYVNGQTVSSWPDLAVADGNANNATSTGTPIYVPNSLNGKPIIKIAGTSDRNGNGTTTEYDFYAISPTIPNVKTIALVFKPTSNTYYTWSTIMSGPTSDNYGWHGDTHWGSAYWDYAYSVNSITSSVLAIDGNSNAAPSGGGYKSVDYDNFHVIIIKLADGSSPFDLGFLAHTARYNSYNEYGMEIAELLVYDQHLTEIEENQLGSYLGNKYGISTSYLPYVDPTAYSPSPTDANCGLPASGVTLTWNILNGISPKSTVWFGPQGNMTQRASGLTTNSYATGPLNPDTDYEWRIDIVDGGHTYTGVVWNFRTVLNSTKILDWGFESASSVSASPAHQQFIPAANTIAAASGDGWGPVSDTLNDNGLYGMKHIAYPYGYSWISDLYGGQNLHPVDGSDYYNWGAWVEYTFDTTYSIGNMYVWNQNQTDLTNRGLQNVTVQYSANGTTWNTLGNYVIPQANGLNGLTPYAINFGGISAKYVVITAALTDGQYGPDAGGSDSYYALAKVRFGINGTSANEVITPDSANYGTLDGDGIVKGNPQIAEGFTASDHCMSFSGDNDVVASNLFDSTFPAAGSEQWSMNFYVYITEELNQYDILAGIGSPLGSPDGTVRYIINYGRAQGNHGNQIYFWGHNAFDLPTNTPFDIAQWQMITVTYDGLNLKIYKNGSQIASKKMALLDAAPVVNIANKGMWSSDAGKFKGKIDNFSMYKGVLSQSEINALAQQLPLTGNFNKDSKVDFKDFATLSEKWLNDTSVKQWPTTMLADCENPADFTRWSVPSSWNTGIATIKLIEGDSSNPSDPNQPFEGRYAVRMTYDNRPGSDNNKWSAVDVNLAGIVDMTKYDLLRIHLKRHAGNSREQGMFFRGYSPEGAELFNIDEATYSTDFPAGVWEFADGASNGNIVIWCDWFPFAHRLAKIRIGAKMQTGTAGGTGTIDIDNITLERFDNCLGTIQEGDFNADCRIDFEDVQIFIGNWLKSE